MKQKLYYRIGFVAFLWLTLCFLSCQKEEKFVPLKVFSVLPADALVGDTIVITGEGFSPDPSVNGIFFPGATRITPIKKTQSQLWVVVPDGATPGPVMVNILDEEVASSPSLFVKVPSITKVEPADAWVGDTVTLTGVNFRPRAVENRVYFKPGQVNAATVIGGSSTELKVIVPFTSKVSTTNIFGFDGPSLTLKTPFITSVSPAHGAAGQVITITGKGLPYDGSAQPELNGMGTVFSGTESTSRAVKVVVPGGATDGVWTLKYADDYVVSSAEIFEVYPEIKDVVPVSGAAGVPVTFTGTGFSHLPEDNQVYFNGKLAVVTEASKTELVALVPSGFSTGPVWVVVNERKADGPVFSEADPDAPIIYSISPNSGPALSQAVITGKNFAGTAAGNSVKIGSVAATVVTATTTQVTVKIPASATTGPLSVTKGGLTGIGPKFTVTTGGAKPFISSIQPDNVSRGETITLRGGNFSATSADIVVNTPDGGGQLTVVSAAENEVVVMVPMGFPAGTKALQVSQFSLTSNAVPVFVKGSPQIKNLSLTEGFPGNIVTLEGTDFGALEKDNLVKFGSVDATLTDANDPFPDRISVYVPDLAPGNYQVTVAVGNVSAPVAFRVKEKPVAVKNVYMAAQVTITAGQTWKILKSTFDPPTLTDVYNASNAGLGISILSADFASKKIYMLRGAALARCNFTNTGYEELYTEAEAGAVSDFTLNTAAGKLYWTTSDAVVMRGNLDGSGTPEKWLSFENGNVGYLTYGLSYNPADDMLYLIEYDAVNFVPAIGRMKADGSGTSTQLYTQGLTEPHDVRVDTDNNKMFVVDGMETILAGKADGTGALSSFITIPPGELLVGMSLDVQDQYVYWAVYDNASVTHVYRKRYDGELIPGTDPASNVQSVYSIKGSVQVGSAPTGLVVEESTGRGGAQRGSFSGLTLKTLSHRPHQRKK
ncbi:IPT/TIG domain-containing protein [Chryseolinea lacunae]|uniref:IPT/TIG domain-containing protein n=1 Tax=Chryseolinea lacunae TaxID=2801331 RepID=A0ABS1L1N0_9BACT|nr:IPT/TIG domain-containing protein [Chryseolinea lacunae]MBL0745599.1 IPT/TIG domain-containing protein [Chryseolinea lacunae]